MFNRFKWRSKLPTRWQRVAIVDLGSNTARLVVMNMLPGFTYRVEDEVREVVRLHHGMTEAGLSEEASDRAFRTLTLFKHLCDSFKVDRVIPTATSAVRSAANGPAFLARVKRELGWELRVLSGEREAYYGTLGALNEVPLQAGYVVDIGGGSMQISRVQGCRYSNSASLRLGALALTERFVHTDPIRHSEYEDLRQHIRGELNTLPWVEAGNGCALVGLGGTIRNLAKIESKRQDYPLGTLNGFYLTRGSIRESIELFRRSPVARRASIPGLSDDRADIILAGAVVIAEIMDHIGVDALTISENGVREGLFFEQFWAGRADPVAEDIRRFSVQNVARVYNYNQPHCEHVAFLAERMFSYLAPLHGLGPADLELLEAAAQLHDLGMIINHRDHDKNSQVIITGNGLPGYNPRETALIGLMARYHRKGAPELGDYGPLMDKGDGERLVKLTSLLRIAEYLDRGRSAIVENIRVDWDARTITLRLYGHTAPEAEVWDTQRNAVALMERAFGRQVLVEYVGRYDPALK